MNIKMIKTKCQTLMLCLECINLYTLANSKLETNQKFGDLFDFIYKKHKQNNKNRYVLLNYNQYSSLLNEIYNFTNKYYIKKNIIHILEDYSINQYCLNKASRLTQQYLKKFSYKYQKVYVNTNLETKYAYHHSKITQIYKTAILNLYILKKIQGKEGIYQLFKYLQTI